MNIKKKKLSCLFIALFCSTIFLGGCNTESLNWNLQGDWSYELCRGYYISRSSNTSIALTKEQNIGFSYVVEAYVTCFSYNENFIAVRKLCIPDYAMFEDIMKMDFDIATYYLIDAQDDEVLGPFADKEAFETACADQKTGNLGEWIPTYPAPAGAKF